MFTVVCGGGSVKKRAAPLPPQGGGGGGNYSYSTLPSSHSRSPSDPNPSYHTLNHHKRSPSTDSTRAIHLGQFLSQSSFLACLFDYQTNSVGIDCNIPIVLSNVIYRCCLKLQNSKRIERVSHSSGLRNS